MSGIEIIGLAASVIQIAEVGLKLSVKLFTFTRKVKSADKGIDALSHDIAATGAVLQALGSTLSEKGCVQICSPQAIKTATDLLSDCQDVFCRLEQVIGSPGAGQKGKVNLVQRLHFTFMESQVDELRANLERLKSSLLVIIQVLMLAEQLRNRETLPLIQETQQMLESLILENTANEKRYNALVKLIEDKADKKVNPTQASPQSPPAYTSAIAVPTTKSADQNPTMRHYLPEGLQYHRQRILDHGALVTSLLQEVSSDRYKIDHAHRSGLHDGILNIHWDAWSNMRYKYGSQVFMELLAEYEDVARHWADRNWSNTRSQPYIYGSVDQVTASTDDTPENAHCRLATYSEEDDIRLESSMSSQQQFDIGGRHSPRRRRRIRENGESSIRPGVPSILPSALPQEPKKLRSACDSCFSAKVRCDGNKTGCRRCSEKRLDCHYSESRVGKVDENWRKRSLPNMRSVSPTGAMEGMEADEPRDVTEPNHALQDYQMQLMLLEQQNRKRLMMARQEQAQADRPVNPGILTSKQSPADVIMWSSSMNTGNLHVPLGVTTPEIIEGDDFQPCGGGLDFQDNVSIQAPSTKNTNMKSEPVALPQSSFGQESTPQSTHPTLNQTDEASFNLDFGELDSTDVLENFDFDSFLTTSNDQDVFDFCTLTPEPEPRTTQAAPQSKPNPREGRGVPESHQQRQQQMQRASTASVPSTSSPSDPQSLKQLISDKEPDTEHTQPERRMSDASTPLMSASAKETLAELNHHLDASKLDDSVSDKDGRIHGDVEPREPSVRGSPYAFGSPVQQGKVVQEEAPKRFEADVLTLLLRYSTLSEDEVSVLVRL